MQLSAAALGVTLLLGGNGLIIKDLKKGHGKPAKSGDVITVNYTGKLLSGKVFDSSIGEGRTPFEVTLGAGQVIKGWEKGLVGIKVGGRRKLVIPPELAYGNRQVGNDIKPNSTLVFIVDCLKINGKSK